MKEKLPIYYMSFLILFCCCVSPQLALLPSISSRGGDMLFFTRLGVIIGLILLITAAFVLNAPKWVASTVKTFVVIAILCIIILAVVFYIISAWS